MSSIYLYVCMALVGGMGLSLQAAINSNLSAGMGGEPLMAALISFFVGTVCLAIVSYYQVDWSGVTRHASEQTWWRWMGGMIGAGFVFTSIFLAPKLGIANTMFLFILGQLSAGMLIDHFGLLNMPLRPVHWWKFIGIAIMIVGLVFFMFGEKLFSPKG